MKYYQLASITTPKDIQEWLENELLKRGIDNVYARVVLSILKENFQNIQPSYNSNLLAMCQQEDDVKNLVAELYKKKKEYQDTTCQSRKKNKSCPGLIKFCPEDFPPLNAADEIGNNKKILEMERSIDISKTSINKLQELCQRYLYIAETTKKKNSNVTHPLKSEESLWKCDTEKKPIQDTVVFGIPVDLTAAASNGALSKKPAVLPMGEIPSYELISTPNVSNEESHPSSNIYPFCHSNTECNKNVVSDKQDMQEPIIPNTKPVECNYTQIPTFSKEWLYPCTNEELKPTAIAYSKSIYRNEEVMLDASTNPKPICRDIEFKPAAITYSNAVCPLCFDSGQMCTHVSFFGYNFNHCCKLPGWQLTHQVSFGEKIIINPWFVSNEVTTPKDKIHNINAYINYMKDELNSEINDLLSEIKKFSVSATKEITINQASSNHANCFGLTYMCNPQYYNFPMNEPVFVVYTNNPIPYSVPNLSLHYDNFLSLAYPTMYNEEINYFYPRWSTGDQYDANFENISANTYCDTAEQQKQNSNIMDASGYYENQDQSIRDSEETVYQNSQYEIESSFTFSPETSHMMHRYWWQETYLKDSCCAYLPIYPRFYYSNSYRYIRRRRYTERLIYNSTQPKVTDCKYKLDSEVDFPSLSPKSFISKNIQKKHQQ